ncbi:hypothetical protein AALP_AA8G431400 [Arabis alpina]|uniref:Uncharacterized protein n=1 Tax=Arabis alpina TaxID=50452 RepID=A0A087GD53_ARAAL|nr:hypothetical protein AALP_AA8G431400 [Arabis alpina]
MSATYIHASVGLFWDTVACPIFDTLCIDSASNNMCTALKNSSYRGEPRNSNVKAEGSEFERMRKITLDMYLFVLEHPDSVVMFVCGDMSRRLSYVNELSELETEQNKLIAKKAYRGYYIDLPERYSNFEDEDKADEDKAKLETLPPPDQSSKESTQTEEDECMEPCSVCKVAKL